MSKFLDKFRTGFNEVEICRDLLKAPLDEDSDILEFISYLGDLASRNNKLKTFLDMVLHCWLIRKKEIAFDESFINAYKNGKFIIFLSRNPELRFVFDEILDPYLKIAKIRYIQARKEWVDRYGEEQNLPLEESPESAILRRASDSFSFLEERDYQKAYWSVASIPAICEEFGLELYVWAQYEILLNQIYLFTEGGKAPEMTKYMQKLLESGE